jgi:hypothetical protein
VTRMEDGFFGGGAVPRLVTGIRAWLGALDAKAFGVGVLADSQEIG